MNSVKTIQPTRAMSSQRPCPCRRVTDSLRALRGSTVLVGLCCRFIDAPGSCLHENCLCMQALLSCLVSYHIIVSQSLRKALRTAGVRFPPPHSDSCFRSSLLVPLHKSGVLLSLVWSFRTVLASRPLMAFRLALHLWVKR